MTLPRILIIDDQYGGVRENGRNRLREDLCFTVGLQDVTEDVKADRTDDPLAEAVFCRGQVVDGGVVHNDLEGTLDTVRRGWAQWPRWALILLDMEFRTGSVGADGNPVGEGSDRDPEKYFGLKVLEHLWRDPVLCDIPVVILSGMPREQIERRFADHGVFDFVDKNDLTHDRLRQLLWDYGLLESDTIIGRSIAFLRCLREARKRARIGTDNILLLGETGTGKELLARYIHDNSPRSGGPYVTVYTQGVPETLVDDRLFGHEPSAYSGAKGSVNGAAEEADKGTLFIDEFGDLPASIQPKLLRLLDKSTRETQRLGAKSNETRKLDLQVVLATNRLDIMDADDFRKDLLARANTADAILVPPLRERQEDIPLLVGFFVHKFEREFRDTIGTEPRTISPEAMQMLSHHEWSGNVRSLERAIESAIYRFPRLRLLAAGHLRLPASPNGVKRPASVPKPAPPAGGSESSPPGLGQLLEQFTILDLFSNAEHRSEWVGRLPEVQAVFARVAAQLLKAALIATSKPTPQNPSGEIKIHPAVKLAMGDERLTASKAADIVKRVVSMDSANQQHLMADPILKEAYEIAVRLRPKGVLK